MLQIIIIIIAAGVSLIAFLYFLITGIIKKKKPRLVIAIFAFFLTIGLGSWGAYIIISRSYQTVKEALAPRKGQEIYNALFGKSANECVSVLNSKDQVVPRLDCCIWLEFKTCPQELKRIIVQDNYISALYGSADPFIPDYDTRPSWWNPQTLGDSAVVLRRQDNDDPNRDKIMVFSKDSMHVFYCDMAE